MKIATDFTENLTRNEKKIIEYFYQNLQQLPSMTIQDIADKANVSIATVSRLPRHLGYQNLKEMKRNLINDLSPAKKINSSLNQQHTVLNYLESQKTYLDKTMSYLDGDVINNIVTKIIDAKTIYIFAKGASECLAQLLLFRLRRFKKQVIIMPSSGSQLFEVLPMIDKSDFVVAFGFLKTPVEGQVVLKYCHEHKIKSMLMTSRLIENEVLADYHIYVYRGEEKIYHSMAVPIALIDALVIEIAKTGGDEYMKQVEDVYNLKEKYKTKIQR